MFGCISHFLGSLIYQSLCSSPNPTSTFKPNLEPSDQNAQRPLTLNTQKEISMHMEKHKDCQLESATMDSRSSLRGAIGTDKTDPTNAYQQQNAKWIVFTLINRFLIL
jgi:hypothetical protein